MINFVKLEKEKLITDPIHTRIIIEYQVIWDLINTKEFQRLRFIRQLGASFYVYPTAEHSRFCHSLGTYEVARKIVTNVKDIASNLNEEERVSVLIAALLHDLGHGPLSHAFEMVHEVSHEEYSIKIIMDDSEVNQVLKNIDISLPRKVADIIEKKCKKIFMWQIISSQIDADRMDYLLRDAYFTGLSYGNFDINRIQDTMRLIDNKIIFRNSGISAIENFVLGRYHMYQQLYLHPTSLAMEILYSKWMKRVGYLYKNNYQFKNDLKELFPVFSSRAMTVAEYNKLNDTLVFYFIDKCQEESDEILRDLSNRFINRIIFNYKSVDTETQLIELRNRFKDDYYYHELHLNQVIYKRKVGGKDQILISYDNKSCDLFEASNIVKSIASNKRIDRGEYYIFTKDILK